MNESERHQEVLQRGRDQEQGGEQDGIGPITLPRLPYCLPEVFGDLWLSGPPGTLLPYNLGLRSFRCPELMMRVLAKSLGGAGEGRPGDPLVLDCLLITGGNHKDLAVPWLSPRLETGILAHL